MNGTPSAGRVVYVLDRFPVPSQTFVANEVSELRALGHHVRVVTSRPPLRVWDPTSPLTAEGGRRVRRSAVAAHLHFVRGDPRRYVAYLRVLWDSPFRDGVFLLWAPAAAVEIGTSDHVHTHFAFRAAAFARGVSALLGSSRSVTTHANDIFVHEHALPRRLAGARVLTISDFNRRYLAERGIGSVVNHCGVDVDALDEVAGRARAGRQVADIAFVGRLVDKKSPLLLIEAVDRLRRLTGETYRLVMVGDGPLWDACRSLARRLDCPVELTGALSGPATLDVIAASRCLCLPSRPDERGDQDGIPVVLMEAMGLGTPVVTTTVSGIPELVRPTAGWLVDDSADDVAGELARALHECLSAPDVAAARSRVARGIVAAEFSLRAQALGVVAEAGTATQAATAS